jgi:FMN-dependent NADH-azoreductase
MADILYVSCNLKPVGQSRSLSVGAEFLDAYVSRNPDDRIHAIDLYRDPIQRIDADVLSGWAKRRDRRGALALTDDEQRKLARLDKLADHFAAVDKYVFVTPMWNLGFPAELKMYIDAVCVVGKAFRYTERGVEGLLRGRKCLHIHASGGFHHGRPEDHSVPYLRSIMSFMGVDDFESVVLEGLDAVPHRASEIRQAATKRALALAQTF